jgi:hypothetical protein
MYLQDIEKVLGGQFVKIKYDCDGGFARCGKEWMLKLKDAKKNFVNNKGKHLCRQCQLKTNNPARRKDVQEKIKKTNLERYGASLAANTEANIAARNEKMFGTQEAIDARTEKTRKTNQERFGADHIMKTEEGVKRLNKSMQEIYGVDFPLQSEEIKENMRKTCQERYGVDNPCQIPEIRVKMARTTLERFGVEHYNQLPEMKDYLREHCKEWLAESYKAGGPNAGKERPKEWNEKQSKTMAAKIVAGDFNPEDSRFYITGYFYSNKCKKPKAFFRSSLELRTHYMLEMDDDVIWYENEPFAIPYETIDGVRNYIPDFFVFRKSVKGQLLEIKPAFRIREEEVKYKVEVAEQYALENGCSFFYLDEKFLKKEVPLTLEELKELPNIELMKPK